MTSIQQRSVTFHSDGIPLKGILYLPAGLAPGERRAGIVGCLGFGLIKEVLLPPYARSLCEMGYVVLLFDYRSFGESGGTTRNRLCPPDQHRDIRNAISFMQSVPEVNPDAIGLFGTSLGASNAVTTAGQDSRVKATVAVAGPGDLERAWRNFPTFEAFRTKVWNARRDFVRTGEATQIDVTRLLSSDPETCKVLLEEKKKQPQWDLTVTFESLADLFEFRPEEHVAAISPNALLLIYPTEDALIARFEVVSQFAKAREPKELVVLQGALHHHIYQQGPVMDEVMAGTRTFLAKYLPPTEK